MNYTIISTHPELFLGSLGKQFYALTVEFEGKHRVIVVEKNGNRVVLSDEGYWNPSAAVGDDLRKMVLDAHLNNMLGGAVITPYALTEFGGKASFEQLLEIADIVDFVAIDPYLIGDASTDALIEFSKNITDKIHSMNKKVILCIQGFAAPGKEALVREYNRRLMGIPFDEILVCDAYDFPDIPDEWQISIDDIISPKDDRSFLVKVKDFFEKIFNKIKSLLK